MARRKALARQLPRLNRESDTAAQTAWRQRSEPNTVVRLPRGFDPFEKAAGSGIQRTQSISYKTQVHIVPKQIRGVRGAIEFQIWGTPSQCAAAVHEIDSWAREQLPTKSSIPHGKDSFARVQAYFEEKQPAILNRLKIEERRQQYRQQRPIGASSFVSVYVLKWGFTDWPPEEVLGHSLEGLDPIRMDCLCYIDFLKDTSIAAGPCFVVAGQKPRKVKAAVERLQNIDNHIIAHKFERCKFFLLKPPHDGEIEDSGHRIRHYEYFKPTCLKEADRIEDCVSGVVMSMVVEDRHSLKHTHRSKTDKTCWSIEDVELGSVRLGAKYATHHTQQYLDLWLTSTLEYLPYFSGYLKMRASLGTCVFTNYKRAESGVYDQQTFEEMLESRNTQENEVDSYFTDELGNKHAESALLHRFFAASHLLSFKNAPFYGAPIEICKPVYKAIFHVEGPDNSSDYRLEVDYKEESDGDYHRDPIRWLRLDSAEHDLTRMVDITLVDLVNGYTSYNLSISASQILNPAAIAKLPVSYSNFANSVDLNLGVARTFGKNTNFFSFPRSGATLPIPVLRIEQRRCWQFSVVGSSGYIVEVFTTQACEYSKGTRAKPREERWGVQVFHEQWDNFFNENQTLGIGERTAWEPTESQFFSAEGRSWYDDREGMDYEVGSGYTELLRIMGVVENVVKSSAAMSTSASKGKGKVKSEEHTESVTSASSIEIPDPAPPATNDLSSGQISKLSAADVPLKRSDNKSIVNGGSLRPCRTGSTTVGVAASSAKAKPSFPTTSNPSTQNQSHKKPWKPGKPNASSSKSKSPPKPGTAANDSPRRRRARTLGNQTIANKPEQPVSAASKAKQPASRGGSSKPPNRHWGAGSQVVGATAATANGKGRAGFEMLEEMEA